MPHISTTLLPTLNHFPSLSAMPEKYIKSIPLPLLKIISLIAGKRLLIPYYHVISDTFLPHVSHLFEYKNSAEFEEDLGWLATHYRPVSLDDILSVIQSGLSLPQNAFLLTFDDGFSEMESVVQPILERMGIPAVFFIPSAFLDNSEMGFLQKVSLILEKISQDISQATEIKLVSLFHMYNMGRVRTNIVKSILAVDYNSKMILDEMAVILELDFEEYVTKKQPYLSTGQVNNLIKAGFSIGAHSIDHPLYINLPIEEQIRQTVESVRELEGRFSLPYRVFAFPHSDLGISSTFFERISTEEGIQLTFGTAGMVQDSISNNLQRFSLEKPKMPANEIIALHWARYCKRKIKGLGRINRGPLETSM